MRSVALLVCAGLVRVGAFASLPDSEQIESRNAGSTHVKVRSNAYCGNRLCKDGACAHSRKADSTQKCAELVMSDAKCGDAFSHSTAEKYCDCPPDGSHCTLADLSSGGYGVYEFQTCGEACFVDVMCTRPSTPGYAIETETLNAPSFGVKFKNDACAAGYAASTASTRAGLKA